MQQEVYNTVHVFITKTSKFKGQAPFWSQSTTKSLVLTLEINCNSFFFFFSASPPVLCKISRRELRLAQRGLTEAAASRRLVRQRFCSLLGVCSVLNTKTAHKVGSEGMSLPSLKAVSLPYIT